MNADEFVRYLDRVRTLYPYGIPHEALEAAPIPTPVAAPRITIVVVSPVTELTEAESELVAAIVSKGLQLTRDDARICVAPADDGIAAVRHLISEVKGGCAVVMGANNGGSESPPVGTWEDVGGIDTLYTVGLAEVASSKEAKREFWGHLKLVSHRLANAGVGTENS